MAETKVSSGELAPRKYTDANGWTVHDFGSYKLAFKTKAWSITSLGNNATAFVSITGNDAPVGYSSGFTMATATVTSNAGGIVLNPETGTAWPQMTYVARNVSGGTASFSGTINYQVIF